MDAAARSEQGGIIVVAIARTGMLPYRCVLPPVLHDTIHLLELPTAEGAGSFCSAIDHTK
jgi:hypothetical protein